MQSDTQCKAIYSEFGIPLSSEERLERKLRYSSMTMCGGNPNRYLQYHSQGRMSIFASICDNSCLQHTINYLKENSDIPMQCYVCYQKITSDNIFVVKPPHHGCANENECGGKCAEGRSLYLICSNECKKYMKSSTTSCKHNKKETTEYQRKDTIEIREECVKCQVKFSLSIHKYCCECKVKITKYKPIESLYYNTITKHWHIMCGDKCQKTFDQKVHKELCRKCIAVTTYQCPCNEGYYYCDEVCWYEDKEHIKNCKYLLKKREDENTVD